MTNTAARSSAFYRVRSLVRYAFVYSTMGGIGTVLGIIYVTR